MDEMLNEAENTGLGEPVGEEGGVIGGPIQEIDPEKLKQLQERLAEFKKGSGETASGSENPDAAPKFDETKWEVEPDLLHLYKRSFVEQTPEGEKFIVIEHQYMIHAGAWHVDGGGQEYTVGNRGKKVTRAKGLDQIITDVVNGPDGLLSREKGWRLSALLPGQSQLGGNAAGVAVFERQVKRALPDPKPIINPEEQPLEETTDEELARLQERAEGWQGDDTADAAAADSSEPGATVDGDEAGSGEEVPAGSIDAPSADAPPAEESPVNNEGGQ